MRYSGARVIWEGLTGNRGWKPVWRDPTPKPDYDIIIIGGGGHGLATAYYLAKEHGLKNIAVLEKGYLGGGSVGRTDSGIGIPAQDVTRVFERFFQVDSHLTRKHGGMGLGLAVAKAMIEMHGGRIAVESVDGKGTSISFLLPIESGATKAFL